MPQSFIRMWLDIFIQIGIIRSMEIKIYEPLLRKLADAKGNWGAISERTGVPYSTLCKIAQREIENPGVKHVEALMSYFAKEEASQ